MKINGYSLIIMPILIIAVLFTGGFSVFGALGLVGAGISMPEGTAQYILDYLGDENSAVSITRTSTPSAQGENYAAASSKVSVQDLTQSPSDILSLIEEAKKTMKDDKKDGNISERTYSKAHATDTFGSVFVKNATTKKINIEKILKEDLDLKITDKSKPSVLIFHTHTTESYETLDRGFYAQNALTRRDDLGQNTVRVGLEIKNILNDYGYNVIHDTTIYDHVYTGSYDKSRVSVEKYLKENPSIQIVIDVHRDSIQQNDGVKIKPTTKINGKKAAQIMIITGCEDGKVKKFPDWEINLRFALQLHKKCEELYPSLMRPVLFGQRKYNMDTSHCGILLEMGSEANTLEEAAYSGRLVGNAMAQLMEDYTVT